MSIIRKKSCNEGEAEIPNVLFVDEKLEKYTFGEQFYFILDITFGYLDSISLKPIKGF